jgi:Holliday junction DNA helicase RuvA
VQDLGLVRARKEKSPKLRRQKRCRQLRRDSTANDFRRCVEYEDAATLAKVPGIGKKTAERLIMEMRDKVENVGVPSLPGGKVTAESSPRAEAFDALVALGYKPNEVNKLLGKLDIDELSAEDIIRLALKQVAA